MTTAAYKAVSRDYRGYSLDGVPQMLTVNGIVNVVLTDAGREPKSRLGKSRFAR